MRSKTILVVILVCCVGVAQGTVIFDDGETHNITDWIEDNVFVRDDDHTGLPTIVNVLDGGVIFGGLYAYENSLITSSGGNINYNLTAYDTSIVNVSGGMSQWLTALDSSEVTFSSGFIRDYLYASGNSVVTFSGGYIIAGSSNAQTVFGEPMDGSLIAYDNSIVTVSGGSIGGAIIAGRDSDNLSEIIFEGSEFAVNGIPFGYGTIDIVQGRLTGTLANGDTLDNDFYLHHDSSIVLVPEPSTLLLLGLGGLLLRKKEKP